jgi:hypothetical protein
MGYKLSLTPIYGGVKILCENLGSRAARREGSSPSFPTNICTGFEHETPQIWGVYVSVELMVVFKGQPGANPRFVLRHRKPVVLAVQLTTG